MSPQPRLSPMNDLKETIERVRELDAKATQGKWRSKLNHAPYKCVFFGKGEEYSTLELKPEDADLIAHYRTAAPQLATACEDLLAENARLRGLIEAAPHGRDCEAMWYSSRKPLACDCWKSRALPPAKP